MTNKIRNMSTLLIETTHDTVTSIWVNNLFNEKKKLKFNKKKKKIIFFSMKVPVSLESEYDREITWTRAGVIQPAIYKLRYFLLLLFLFIFHSNNYTIFVFVFTQSIELRVSVKNMKFYVENVSQVRCQSVE